MNPNDLPQAQKDEVLQHFRDAVASRIAQWDNELAIEIILDQDVELNLENYATYVADPAELQWDDFLEALASEE